MFSNRSSWDLTPNKLTELLAQKRRVGEPVFDLTNANPMRADLAYPPALQDILARPTSLDYQPDALGLPAARQAIQDYYTERGIATSMDRILLTASTSEAYSFLFKLLADPGDHILVPQPSYPLFEFLAELEHLETRSYPLRYDQGWYIDLDRLAAAITPRTRAIILVHPNNPTGSFIKKSERQVLEALAEECNIALIVDEVFADYAWCDDPERVVSFAGTEINMPTNLRREAPVLTFTLSGLSKVMGLPQMKLGWMVMQGPEARRREAWQRLEIIADTYLSVSSYVQQILPQLLPLQEVMQQLIRSRVIENLHLVQKKVNVNTAATLLVCTGGWYATLAMPMADEERWALTVLRQSGVYIHPGYFFDFKQEGFFVLSLLTPQQTLCCGLDKLLKV